MSFVEAYIHTPPQATDIETLARAIGIVHVEFILIHPFREGNGRLARLLATLMSLQANGPVLDFSPMTGKGMTNYIAAIHRGVVHDYKPITTLFKTILEKSQ